MHTLGLQVIGSRTVLRATGGGEDQPTTQLIAAGKTSTWSSLEDRLQQLSNREQAAQQLRHLEEFAYEEIEERFDPSSSEDDVGTEIVLQAMPRSRFDVVAPFIEWVGDVVGEEVGATHRIALVQAGTLSYFAFRGRVNEYRPLLPYAFLRRMRALRRVRLTSGDRLTDDIVPGSRHEPRHEHRHEPSGHRTRGTSVPAAPLALLLDGPVASLPVLAPYVVRQSADDVSTVPGDLCERHGTAVASSLLFGPGDSTGLRSAPVTKVVAVPVISATTDMVSAASLVRAGLRKHEQPLVNLSLGSLDPMRDDVVDAWTAIVDEAGAVRDRLITVAAGNASLGQVRPRIGAPADGVNILSVGALATRSVGSRVASYSATGPGRSPGRRKPDMAAFGGESPDHPFHVLDVNGGMRAEEGTSFAAPLALRLAAAVGRALPPQAEHWLAVRALLIHSALSAARGEEPLVGWGRLAETMEDVLETPNDTARLLSTGLLSMKRITSLPLPVASSKRRQLVNLAVTICIRTPVNPADAAHYTQAGVYVRLEVPGSSSPSGPPYDRVQQDFVKEARARNEYMKWEPVIHWKQRCFTLAPDARLELHALRRAFGGDSTVQEGIPYACVVTTHAPGEEQWYRRVRAQLGTRIQPLAARVRIRV